MNYKRNINQEPQKGGSFISLLLGIAIIATTSAYFIYRFMSERTYRRKWSDYDDCGLA